MNLNLQYIIKELLQQLQFENGINQIVDLISFEFEKDAIICNLDNNLYDLSPTLKKEIEKNKLKKIELLPNYDQYDLIDIKIVLIFAILDRKK